MDRYKSKSIYIFAWLIVFNPDILCSRKTHLGENVGKKTCKYSNNGKEKKTIVRSKKTKTARVDSRGLITKLDKRKTVIKKESPFGYYNLYMKACCCCCCCCGSPRYNKPLFSFFFKTILKKLSPQKEGRYSSNPSEYRYTLNSISQVNPIRDYSNITRTNIPYIFHQLSTVYAK